MNYDNTGVTVELGEIVESGVNIWDFEYPVPAETVTYNGKTATVPFDKEELQQKIIDHYRFRQIGQETVGRWLHYFRTRMREIMPYYKQLYEFEAKWFNIDDPLESYNLLEEFEQETQGSGTLTDNSTGTNSQNYNRTKKTETKFSDTPQGQVSNVGTYLTNFTGVDDTETDNGSAQHATNSEQSKTDTGTTKYTLNKRGNIGVQPLGSEVNNIRDAFINIDMKIIDELKDLFLQVY